VNLDQKAAGACGRYALIAAIKENVFATAEEKLFKRVNLNQ
jgi:hypothetical protein